MATTKVPLARDAAQVAALLDSPEVSALIADLEATRWTGRPGYPIRAMVGLALVKSLHAIPTWTRTVALVKDHAGLRDVLGAVPSTDAAYRFSIKLRVHGDMLARCIAGVLAALHSAHPEMGNAVAIDGSDLPAYANGQRYVKRGGELRKRFADPDRPGATGLLFPPVRVAGITATRSTPPSAPPPGCPSRGRSRPRRTPRYRWCRVLLDSVMERGFAVQTAILDRGYDTEALYTLLEDRDIRPVIPLRQTPAVKAGKHLPPSCDHGTWTFAGSDAKRGASKWRCPTGECAPASRWIKADRLHTLIPRGTDRWKSLYHQRGGVEREFGRLKHEWAMLPLRVRRIARVRLHVDLTILAQLASALLTTRIP